MRAGMNPSLEKRLRRADPTVGLMVDAIVQDREDVKKTSTGWNGADSLTGLTVKTAPQEAGVELSLNLGVNLTNTTKDGNMTDLDGPPGYDGASPFFTAQVTWGGTEPPAFLLQRIKAWLDPDTGGGQNVTTWIAQLYAVRTLTEVIGHSGTIEELDLVPIMDPVRATAGASAGEVTFNLQGLQVRPKQLGAPAGGSALGYPDPITILFIWAAQSDGTPATNVGWARDSVQPDKTTAGNKLEGVRLTKALGQRYTVSGSTGGLPYLTLEWSSYTTATISFTAAGAGNNIDLGAAPSNGVQFIMRGFTPGGTSLKPEVNDGSGWVEVRDGDFADTDNTPTGGLDLSVTGTRVLKQQTYDIRCQLITNATTDVTPKLTELGAAEATITDFANLTTVSGGQWAVDPVTLKGEITQIAISAIRDGLNDYRDKITTLLSENDIGTIKFRVWWGASDLAHNKWVLVDVFNVRDYDPSGAAIVVTGVSALAKLKAVLPVVSASASEPYTQTNAGLQTVYDDLMDGQLGLDGQYRGPGVEDDTTTVTNEVSDSNVKVELDAIARCARGSIIASQGRVKFVQMFDDGGGTVVVFPPEELVDVRVLPGFRERRPEFFVPWNYNFTQKRYQDRVQITHTTAISKLGLTGLGNPPVLDDATARWVDSQALAEQIGQDTVKALATGLMLWSFGSTQPYPELEPGDRVTVPTERFVAKDPLAARALRGRLWVIGRVVQVSVDARRFAVWIQGYTDIFTSETAVTVTKFAVPEVLEIVPTMNVSREVSAVIMTKAAVSVKVSVSTLDYPSLATTQGETAQDVDSDGVYSSGTLATVGVGEQLFITTLAYELTGGGGSESTVMGKARIVHQNVEVEPSTEAITDGWSGSQNAAAPENGNEVLEVKNSQAYSNLEDANEIATTYNTYHSLTNAANLPAGKTATLTLYKNDGPTSATWTEVDSVTYTPASGDLADQVLDFMGAMDADWDLLVTLMYSFIPAGPGEQVTITMHGEDHGTEAGVQYDKITTSSVSTIDASQVVSGELLVSRGGIGIAAPTVGNLLVGAGSSAMTQLAPGAAAGYARSTGSAWARSGLLAGDLTGTVASARLSGVYSAITGLGTQAQALDMGTNNITNIGTITSSGIAIESGSPVLTLKDTNTVLGNVNYSSYIKGTDSTDAQAWWLGDGSSGYKRAAFWATTGYELGLYSNATLVLMLSGSSTLATFSGSVSMGALTTAGITVENASEAQVRVKRTAATVMDAGMYANSGSFGLYDWTNSDSIIYYVANGALSLYYNNSVKLATTNTGVQVTGALTASGIVHAQGGKLEVGTAASGGLNNLQLWDAGTYFRIQSFEGLPLVINSLGNNVLIGTTTDAGFKLDVNGTVRTGALTAATGTFTGPVSITHSGDAALQVRGPDSGRKELQLVDTTSGEIWMWSHRLGSEANDLDLYYYSGAAWALRLAVTTSGAFDFQGNAVATGALTVSGKINTAVNSDFLDASGTSTSARAMKIANTTGFVIFGVESSAGGNMMAGSTGYATVLTTVGATVLQLGGNQTLACTFDGADTILAGDLTIGSLGTFDSTSAPSTDFILRYNGSKWVSLYLHTQFLAGDGVSQINGDGTTSAFVYSNPSLSGSPSPYPSVAPVITASHKSIKIDMSAYTLGATETFVLEYSIDGGAYTGNAIVSTGTQVVHATLTPGSTYAYKYKIRGGTATPFSPASSAINPLNDSSAQAFGIVLAADVVATNLAAISADIGDISAGQIRNAANTKGVLLSGSLPGGWTQYIDFVATGANPFIKHDKFELWADGTAIFKGQIDITPQVSQSLQDFHMVLRDSDVTHGMTNLVETNVLGAIGFVSTVRGGLNILGFVEAGGSEPGLLLQGVVGNATVNPAVVVEGWKKSGAGRVAMAATEEVFLIRAGVTTKVIFKGDGSIVSSGDVAGVTGTFSGDITAVAGTFSGAVSTAALTVSGILDLANDIELSERSPAVIGGTVNNYDTGTATVQRLTGGASDRAISGFAGGRAGRYILVCNIGTTNKITLQTEAAGSLAANRISCPNSANYDILRRAGVLLWYDDTSSRWRVVGPVA